LALLQTPGQVTPIGAKFIGQGFEISITTTKTLPAQIDGEPFLLNPSHVTISHFNQGSVIYNKKGDKNEKKT